MEIYELLYKYERVLMLVYTVKGLCEIYLVVIFKPLYLWSF